MLERIDRLAPESPAARLLLAFLTAGPGVPLAAYTLYGFVITAVIPGYRGLPELGAAALVGLLLTTVGFHLARGVASQASAAPREANPARTDSDENQNSETDPVTELQRRYAAGDIDEDELDYRMERLLELDTDAAGQAERAREQTLVE